MKVRLDQFLQTHGMAPTRSQAESYVKLGLVTVDGAVITKPGYYVAPDAAVRVKADRQYVSRAGLKLASVAEALRLDFRGATVLDVGSSTGGFTDYALQHGAARVYAVDVGTGQLHPALRSDPRVHVFEQTDIRDFRLPDGAVPDYALIDVSFISLREILPAVHALSASKTRVAAMFKPQFEAGSGSLHKGVIKNNHLRRDLLKDFETWVKKLYILLDKADSAVAGGKGNVERFYLLQPIK